MQLAWLPAAYLPHEGSCHEVDVVLHAEAQVLLVLLRDGGQVHDRVRQVHAATVLDAATATAITSASRVGTVREGGRQQGDGKGRSGGWTLSGVVTACLAHPLMAVATTASGRTSVTFMTMLPSSMITTWP